jgi:uncharacterized membrane protein YdjX (TVP38/TMEM64 family)
MTRSLRRHLSPRRLALVGLVLAVALYFRLRGPIDVHELQSLAGRYPVLSIAAFLFTYAVSVVALIPTLPLNLMAGFVWGVFAGGALSALGASAGAVLAFLTARYLVGQPLAARFDSVFLAWIQQEILGKGWKFVAFLRLNPIVPTGPINYLLGLTSARILPYSAATLAFLTPPSLLVAWIGKEAGSIPLAGTSAMLWHGFLGLSTAILALVAARYVLKFIRARRKGA